MPHEPFGEPMEAATRLAEKQWRDHGEGTSRRQDIISFNETSVVSVISGGAVWRQMSTVGSIAATIAAWTMIFMSFAYLCAGLMVSWRYSKHARFKLREREKVLAIAQSMGQNVGATVWIFWISILIPVVYIFIGAIVGFTMGMTYGSILAGLFLEAQVPIDDQGQTIIGAVIAMILLCFSFAPGSVAVLFM